MLEPFAESSFLTFAASMAFGATSSNRLALKEERSAWSATRPPSKPRRRAWLSQSLAGPSQMILATLDVTKRGREELCASAL